MFMYAFLADPLKAWDYRNGISVLLTIDLMNGPTILDDSRITKITSSLHGKMSIAIDATTSDRLDVTEQPRIKYFYNGVGKLSVPTTYAFSFVVIATVLANAVLLKLCLVLLSRRGRMRSGVKVKELKTILGRRAADNRIVKAVK